MNLPGGYTYTFSRFPASDAGVILETPSAPPDEAVRRIVETNRSANHRQLAARS